MIGINYVEKIQKNKTTKYVPEFEKHIGHVNDFWMGNTDLWNTGQNNFNRQKRFFKHLQQMQVHQFTALLAVIRYDIFLDLSEKYSCFCPPLDVDVVWHSHLLSPQKYQTFCLDNFGKLKDHVIHSQNGDMTNDKSKQPVHNYNDSNQLFGMTNDEMVRYESMNAWDNYISQVEDNTIMGLLQYSHNPFYDTHHLENALNKNKKKVKNFITNKKSDDDDFDVFDFLIIDEIMDYLSKPKTHKPLTSDTGYRLDEYANCTMPIHDEKFSSNSSGCDAGCAIRDSDTLEKVKDVEIKSVEEKPDLTENTSSNWFSSKSNKSSSLLSSSSSGSSSCGSSDNSSDCYDDD